MAKAKIIRVVEHWSAHAPIGSDTEIYVTYDNYHRRTYYGWVTVPATVKTFMAQAKQEIKRTDYGYVYTTWE